jgi:hypothetical protein
MLKFGKAVAITAFAAVLVQSMPDIARYLRMRNM